LFPLLLYRSGIITGENRRAEGNRSPEPAEGLVMKKETVKRHKQENGEGRLGKDDRVQGLVPETVKFFFDYSRDFLE
jgi:hypothetical protein